jgi:hypothetical protein
MKSKLEDKKLELVKSYAENYYDDLCGVLTNTLDHNNDRWLRDVIKIAATYGFDSGIQAYKDMLEGVGVDAYVQFWLEDNGVELFVHRSNPRGFKPVTHVIAAEPVLAKLQQQAEKIESLEAENNAHKEIEKALLRRIDFVESRLKEAESVIKRLKNSKSMGDIYELKYEIENKFQTKGEE